MIMIDYNNVLYHIYYDIIQNLLYYIHTVYPKLFTKKNVISEINNIILDITKINKLKKKKIKKKCVIRLQKRKEFNTGLFQRKIKLPENIKRCHSRVWANGKIVKKEDKIIYGDRCCRTIIVNKHYCNQHLNNNRYGNYNEEVSNNVINIYKKKSKLYQKLIGCKNDKEINKQINTI
jgi:hypothetical protein